MKMNTNKIKSVNSYKLSTIFIFALVMFMGLSLLQAVPVEAVAATIYVATTGNDTDGNGSESNPFKTITYAISQASDGDTINVAEGTYNTTTGEKFPIDVAKAVTIKSSDGAEATILDAGNLTGVNLKAAATLDGFTIKTTYSLAICIYDNAEGASAINNVINGASLKIGNKCKNITVQGNIITSGHIDMYCGNSGILIEENKVSNYSSGFGIEMKPGDGSYPDMLPNSNVTVKDNEVSSCSTGISQPQGITSTITITGNKVYNTTAGQGIYVLKGSNITVQGNEVHGTNGYGISITEGSETITIQGNEVYNNNDGILIGSKTTGTVTVNENSIYGNAGYGLKNNRTSVVVDATRNWWGAASGPYHETTNPNGTGNAVSDNVLYYPWYTNASRTTLSNFITLTKTGPVNAKQGDEITYTIKYKNEGNFPETNVVITETYPPEVEFVEASPAPTTGNNRWTIGTLDPGDEGTITVTVRIK